MLTIVKTLAGQVQLQHTASKQVLRQWDENATLFFSQEIQGGGILVVDQLGAYYNFKGLDIEALQVLPNPAQPWLGSTAELLATLKDRFFLPPNTDIHHSDFYLSAPSAAISTFPAVLSLDATRANTGAFTLNAAGAPVCQIAGNYTIDIGVSLAGTSAANISQFHAYARLNGQEIPGTNQLIFIRRDEYGGSAAAALTLSLEVGDVFDAVLLRDSGAEEPAAITAYFVAHSTTAPTLAPPKYLQLFDSSGPLNAQLNIWTGTAISDANGEFTADYSAAGFITPPKVFATVLQTEPNSQDRAWATLSGSVTSTQAIGYTLRGTALTLAGLGPTIRTAPNATVQIMALGL